MCVLLLQALFVIKEFEKDATPLDIIAISMGKLQGSEEDIKIDQSGYIYSSNKLKANLTFWSVWLTKHESIVVTQPTIGERESDLLKDSIYLGSVPQLQYLTAVCLKLGLNSENIALTQGMRSFAPKAQDLLERIKQGSKISFAEYLSIMEMAETYWLGTESKNYNKAAAAYSILIEIAPDDVQKSAAYGCRGLQFEEMREFDKAVHDTTMAINLLKACGLEKFEQFAYTLYEKLGRQYQKKNDLEGATKAYQEIFKAHPNYLIMTEKKSVEDKLRELERIKVKKSRVV
jgi:tetratricopeptide (TPR) repeat protein